MMSALFLARAGMPANRATLIGGARSISTWGLVSPSATINRGFPPAAVLSLGPGQPAPTPLGVAAADGDDSAPQENSALPAARKYYTICEPENSRVMLVSTPLHPANPHSPERPLLVEHVIGLGFPGRRPFARQSDAELVLNRPTFAAPLYQAHPGSAEFASLPAATQKALTRHYQRLEQLGVATPLDYPSHILTHDHGNGRVLLSNTVTGQTELLLPGESRLVTLLREANRQLMRAGIIRRLRRNASPMDEDQINAFNTERPSWLMRWLSERFRRRHGFVSPEWAVCAAPGERRYQVVDRNTHRLWDLGHMDPVLGRPRALPEDEPVPGDCSAAAPDTDLLAIDGGQLVFINPDGSRSIALIENPNIIPQAFAKDVAALEQQVMDDETAAGDLISAAAAGGEEPQTLDAPQDTRPLASDQAEEERALWPYTLTIAPFLIMAPGINYIEVELAPPEGCAIVGISGPRVVSEGSIFDRRPLSHINREELQVRTWAGNVSARSMGRREGSSLR
ncbi:hypothetical protein, variant [Fonticula alba]|uniref:Uncharacterized protein n=1 Tax=Fonticula alba TaxID=691883 RepID=A0A058ZHL8_FONAL|nr:hypothetical protein, variant [Fonticula alba]KCV72962.1 hypothetical protein, variant [Fonticula alba]|eukprot:XP_009492663.1 hypothetical protein, variant [Fonticula alba]